MTLRFFGDSPPSGVLKSGSWIGPLFIFGIVLVAVLALVYLVFWRPSEDAPVHGGGLPIAGKGGAKGDHSPPSPANVPQDRTEVAIAGSDVTILGCAGHVLLLDDSPLAGCEIVAIDAAAHMSTGDLLAEAGAPFRLASTTTASDGSFDLRFGRAITVASEPSFRILHLAGNGIPQQEATYRLNDYRERDLVHRLPAGRVGVRTTLSDGTPVSGAIVCFEPLASTSQFGISSSGGMFNFFATNATQFAVHAYQGELRVGGSVYGLEFDPRRRCEQLIELAPMERGALRVRVLDQHGQPVQRFGLRLRWRGRLIRNVTDTDVAAGSLVTGLPETEISVELDSCYTRSPAMYSVPKRSQRLLITPTASAMDELVFRVNVQSRLRIDVDLGPGEPEEVVAVFIRSAEVGPQGDWRRVGVEQFRDDGSTASTIIQTGGSWFSEPLDPGLVEVEIRSERSGAKVFHDWVQLIAGDSAVRALRLGKPLQNK